MMVNAARSLACAGIAASLALSGAGAFTAPRGHVRGTPSNRAPSSSSLDMQPKGCAATPLDKKKVAVFGAGGYLGAVLFGFLQRAGSLYGTGIAAGPSPRAICATSAGAQALNTVLAAQFKFAYAGEDLMRLVDTTDAAYIEERLTNFDAAMLGTTYRLEQRPVTPNTWDKSVNDKTYEIYLDDRYGAYDINIPSDDSDIHTTMFRNSVRACKGAGLSHLVVLETPRTVKPMDFVNILEEEGIAYTYIRAASALKKDKTYSFEKGIQKKLDVKQMPAGTKLDTNYVPKADEEADSGRGDLASRLSGTATSKSEDDQAVYREDVAALMVQSLMALDWEGSRILEVSPSPDSPAISSGYGGVRSKKKFDREWCPNAGLLGKVLSAL